MTTAIKFSPDIGPQSHDSETSEPLKEPTYQQLTFLQEVSPVRTSAPPAKGRASKKGRAPVYGLSSPVLLARYDHALSCWKTLQQSLVGTEFELLRTLPRWGMAQNGELFRLPTPERPIDESDGFAWPTPRATNRHQQSGRAEIIGNRQVRPSGQDYSIDLASMVTLQWATPQTRDYRSPDNPASPRWKRKTEQGWSFNLNDQASAWPTPRASEWKGVGPMGSASQEYMLSKGYLSATVQEAEQATGQLNPCWAEQLMGYPDNWTALDGLSDQDSNSTIGKHPEP